jgi:hypothetical protein
VEISYENSGIFKYSSMIVVKAPILVVSVGFRTENTPPALAVAGKTVYCHENWGDGMRKTTQRLSHSSGDIEYPPG